MWPSLAPLVLQYAVFTTLFPTSPLKTATVRSPETSKALTQKAEHQRQIKRTYIGILARRRQERAEHYRDRLDRRLTKLEEVFDAMTLARKQGPPARVQAYQRRFDAMYRETKVWVNLGKHYAPGGNPFTSNGQPIARFLGLA